MYPNTYPNLTNDEKQWAMFCHLAGILGYVGVPYGNILGPLVVWLVKRNDSAYIDQQGKESLNFHISMAIYQTIAAFSILFLVGIVLLPLVCLLGIVLTVVGAMKASNGEFYHYPLSIRFVS